QSRRVRRTQPTISVADGSLPWRWLGLPQAGRRAFLLLAVVTAFYLLTPRHTASSWEENLFRSGALQVGLGDTLIDINRTGTIRTSGAVAFEIKAEDATGQPKLDLDRNQRWRGLLLNHYEGGRWTRTATGGRGLPAVVPTGVLPDYGPTQYFLT